MFGGMKDKMKDAADKAKDSASTLQEGAGNAFNKLVANSLKEIEALKPVLKKSGFIIGDIIIEMALSPKVNLIVEQVGKGDVSIEDALKEDGLSKTQVLILNSIAKIHGLNSIVEEYQHTIGQIEIELGLPPTVKVHLNSLNSGAFSVADQVPSQLIEST